MQRSLLLDASLVRMSLQCPASSRKEIDAAFHGLHCPWLSHHYLEFRVLNTLKYLFFKVSIPLMSLSEREHIIYVTSKLHSKYPVK